MVRNEHSQFVDRTDLGEHARRLREHLLRVKQTGRPLRVTSAVGDMDGDIDAVILSSSKYDDLARKAELVETLEMIDESMADIEAGRVTEARQAFREIAEKHGLRLSP